MSTKEKPRERSPHANRIRLGKLLEKYNGRILGGIRMTIDKSSGSPKTYKYAFVKLEDEPGIIVEHYPRYRPPGWEEILRSHKPRGWEEVLQKEKARRKEEQEAGRKEQAENREKDVSKSGRSLTDLPLEAEKSVDLDHSDRNAKNYTPPCTPPCTSKPLNYASAPLNQPAKPENYTKCGYLDHSLDPHSSGTAGSEGQILTQTQTEIEKHSPRSTKNVPRGEDYLVSASVWMPNQPAEPAEPDVLHPPLLALDIETCAEPKVSGRGAPKIVGTREALNPWKGEIRLVTVADGAGAVQSFDLRSGALPDEIRAALERCPLIVHHACFDLLFLKVHHAGKGVLHHDGLAPAYPVPH
jgi:hypothetical protein